MQSNRLSVDDMQALIEAEGAQRRLPERSARLVEIASSATARLVLDDVFIIGGKELVERRHDKFGSYWEHRKFWIASSSGALLCVPSPSAPIARHTGNELAAGMYSIPALSQSRSSTR